MSVKVLLAFSNHIFSEGVAALLEGEEDMDAKVLLQSPTVEKQLKSFDPEIVLLDFITLFNTFAEADAFARASFVLVDTKCGDENIVSAFLSRKIAGILMESADSKHLKRAIRAVAKGEIWVDNKTVKNLLKGLNSISSSGTDNLSHREKEIVALVANGYRNKEIGLKLCISEPTVKTHLYRVFQKLGINNRPQLVVYAIKNRLLPSSISP